MTTLLQGIGRHTKEEIEKIGLDDIKAASKILGDKPFFFGDNARVAIQQKKSWRQFLLENSLLFCLLFCEECEENKK